jgi:hypothetical protein
VIVIAIAIPEADIKALIVIFFVEGQPALELHFEESLAVMELCDEVGSVPIVTQANSHDAEIS